MIGDKCQLDHLMKDYIQVLVELAELQDREVGDGTTSVVIIAAELLKVNDIHDVTMNLFLMFSILKSGVSVSIFLCLGTGDIKLC